jgi:hypothetical protein
MKKKSILLMLSALLFLVGCAGAAAVGVRTAGAGALRMSAATGTVSLSRVAAANLVQTRGAGLLVSRAVRGLPQTGRAQLSANISGTRNFSAQYKRNVVSITDDAGATSRYEIRRQGSRNLILKNGQVEGYNVHTKGLSFGREKIKYYEITPQREVYSGFDLIEGRSIFHYDAGGSFLGRSSVRMANSSNVAITSRQAGYAGLAEGVSVVSASIQKKDAKRYEAVDYGDVAECFGENLRPIRSINYIGSSEVGGQSGSVIFTRENRFSVFGKHDMAIAEVGENGIGAVKRYRYNRTNIDPRTTLIHGNLVAFSSGRTFGTSGSGIFNMKTGELVRANTKTARLLRINPTATELVLEQGSKLFWYDTATGRFLREFDLASKAGETEAAARRRKFSSFQPQPVDVDYGKRNGSLLVGSATALSTLSIHILNDEMNSLLETIHTDFGSSYGRGSVSFLCGGKFVLYRSVSARSHRAVAIDVESEKRLNLSKVFDRKYQRRATISEDMAAAIGQQRFKKGNFVLDMVTGHLFPAPLESFLPNNDMKKVRAGQAFISPDGRYAAVQANGEFHFFGLLRA